MARVEVEWRDASTAAVRVTYPRGGTGRGSAADHLDLVLGLLAWGMHGTHESDVRGAADRIRDLATTIATTPEGPLPDGAVRAATRTRGTLDVEIVPWSGAAGLTRVELDLVPSAVGPVPVTKGSPSAPVLLLAGLVAALEGAGESNPDDRLALALALEGLTAWYRVAHRLTPARDAVEAARLHAADRLRAAGQALPPALAGTPPPDPAG
jgi:hypothetical protein